MSLEKSRLREAELTSELDRLQSEIRAAQRTSEEGANVSQQLSKEVGDTDVWRWHLKSYINCNITFRLFSVKSLFFKKRKYVLIFLLANQAPSDLI